MYFLNEIYEMNTKDKNFSNNLMQEIKRVDNIIISELPRINFLDIGKMLRCAISIINSTNKNQMVTAFDYYRQLLKIYTRAYTNDKGLINKKTKSIKAKGDNFITELISFFPQAKKISNDPKLKLFFKKEMTRLLAALDSAQEKGKSEFMKK